MTDKARELLERALEGLDGDWPEVIDELKEEIRAYLAKPEVKRKALSEVEIVMLAKRYDVWTHVIRAIEDALEAKNQ